MRAIMNTVRQNSGINLANFPTIKKMLKTFIKSLEATAVAKSQIFIKDSLQSSDEVAPFIKLSVIRKFYCHCLGRQ